MIILHNIYDMNIIVSFPRSGQHLIESVLRFLCTKIGKEFTYCEFYNCCKNIINNRLTIQEELMKYTKSEIHYSSANTVAMHMLAFSILLGCKTIYLFGLDLNYK